MTGVSSFHREVVATVLPVLADSGFALSGGNALLLHGRGRRPTQDVNLVTDRIQGIAPEITQAVESALEQAGFHVERIDTFSGLLDEWPEMGLHRAEWTVARSGRQVMLQIATGSRSHPPVATDLGPVLDLQDLLAWKVCALCSRGEARDYIDVAAVLDEYTPERLISLAWAMDDNEFAPEDITHVGPRLDEMDDKEFARYGLTPADIADLRRRFAVWPRQETGS